MLYSQQTIPDPNSCYMQIIHRFTNDVLSYAIERTKAALWVKVEHHSKGIIEPHLTFNWWVYIYIYIYIYIN